MTREELIRNLKYTMEKHKNDTVNTFGTNISDMCKDILDYLEQEPISVSVSEKEPDEISEEVTLRFFRNTLKVRWQDMVIYNVEWLKKNWQMEMDIVCGVKPCDDAVSREAVNTLVDELARAISDERCHISQRGRSTATIMQDILDLPSVTQKSGHWIRITNGAMKEKYICSECGRQIENDGIEVLLPIKYPYCHCGAKMVEP